MPFDQDQPGQAQSGGARKQDSGPHPVDMHVGLRLRQRRTLLGMSQERLGDALGLTFQQVQKYERGANRIGASRLFHLSRLLDVSVNYFFDDMPADVLAIYEGPGEATTEPVAGFGEEPQARLDNDPMARKETLDLVRAYYSIGDTGVRRRILDLARTLAKAD
ncbi:MAG: helix-turn-helix transcriptional regulator [Alphaproteobacteria bacterium]|nr:helix-turn-helix transcriptional regulator [Alphaproteobacteria bacterium SS10]